MITFTTSFENNHELQVIFNGEKSELRLRNCYNTHHDEDAEWLEYAAVGVSQWGMWSFTKFAVGQFTSDEKPMLDFIKPLIEKQAGKI